MSLLKKIFGFTLIELLFGFCLMSVLVLASYKFFWLGIRMYHRGETNSYDFMQATLVFEKIKNDFQNTRKYDLSQSYPHKQLCKFSQSEMMFLKAENNELKVVRYFISFKNKNLRRESISLKQYLSGFVNDKTSYVLLENLLPDDFQIQYAYSRFFNKECLWRDVWKEKDPPAHMRIVIDLCHGRENNDACKYEREFFYPMGIVPIIKKREG